MKIHEVKCWPEFFGPLKRGEKTFEIRINDRDYQPGDELVECEWDPNKHDYTKSSQIRFTITYVMHGPQFGLKQGWVILGLRNHLKDSHDGVPSPEKINSIAFAAAHNICEPGGVDARKHNTRLIADAIRQALA